MINERDVPAGVFNVVEHGARGNGTGDDALAIDAAINATVKHGGGIVWFPPGNYLCGTIHVKSNVTLWIPKGATISLADDDLVDVIEELVHDPHADVETTYFNCALLRLDGVHDVSILGGGIIDGNRHKRGGPKPISVKQCSDIAIKDITVRNGPNYSISLIDTERVVIDGVRVETGLSDGIDLDGCRFARVSNCHVDSWDDGICLKASPALGEPVDVQYIAVTNCHVATGCNCFKLGTESSGNFKDITISNCTFYPKPLARRPLGGIAIESVDGSIIDRIAASNITMDGVTCPVFVRLGNRGRAQETPTPGSIQHVTISNIVATDAYYPIIINGIPGARLRNINVNNVMVTYENRAREHAILMPPPFGFPEKENAYPDSTMHDAYPAMAIYCRHASKVAISNYNLDYNPPDGRTAVVCDDVESFHLSQSTLDAAWNTRGENKELVDALVVLVNSKDAVIAYNHVRSSCPRFLSSFGVTSDKVAVQGNLLPRGMEPDWYGRWEK